MEQAGFRVVFDAQGFRRLDPIPSSDEISHFYESQYYHLVRQGGRAPELRRLMDPKNTAERSWLQETLWRDIHHVLKKQGVRRCLDVGAGTGELVAFLCEMGVEAVGIEPSKEAVGLANDHGRNIFERQLGDYAASDKNQGSFDAVLLMNVLEHVPSPRETLGHVKKLLKPKGILAVRVPNDFNALQTAVKKASGVRDWWVAIPDHINYFDVRSLKRFIRGRGFRLIMCLTDFPMEFFCLMGENYVVDPKLGPLCHEKRKLFELALPPTVRRRIYQKMASAGIGRDILLFAAKLDPL